MEMNTNRIPFEIRDVELTLGKSGLIQQKILDSYRLTNEFREIYGGYLLDFYPDGLGVKKAVESIEKFKGVQRVDPVEYRELIIDLIYSQMVLGFQPWEYFSYGLEDKTIDERLEYISNNDCLKYYAAMNTNREAARKLYKKQSYLHFAPFYKREIILVRDAQDKALLEAFCERHDRFIRKPTGVGASRGNGVRIINVADYANIDELFADVYEDRAILCEELIVQDEAFAQIHPSSVNSIRVFTYFDGKDVNIVCSWLKAGRGGAFVDNGGAGGLLAAINEVTGVVMTDASDELARQYRVHPDSGFVFKGFQIPRWEELLSLVKRVAKTLPGVPMIGWDVALSADKGWQVIEGNEMGQICLMQIPTKTGLRDQLTERFEWSKHKAAAARRAKKKK